MVQGRLAFLCVFIYRHGIAVLVVCFRTEMVRVGIGAFIRLMQNYHSVSVPGSRYMLNTCMATVDNSIFPACCSGVVPLQDSWSGQHIHQ